jgi:hypothetical protein
VKKNHNSLQHFDWTIFEGVIALFGGNGGVEGDMFFH